MFPHDLENVQIIRKMCFSLNIILPNMYLDSGGVIMMTIMTIMIIMIIIMITISASEWKSKVDSVGARSICDFTHQCPECSLTVLTFSTFPEHFQQLMEVLR